MIEEGSQNIYTDLGCADADAMQRKAMLVVRIGDARVICAWKMVSELIRSAFARCVGGSHYQDENSVHTTLPMFRSRMRSERKLRRHATSQAFAKESGSIRR